MQVGTEATTGAPRTATYVAVGRYVLCGRVVDSDGNGVFGAVLRVGKAEVATKTKGFWLTRERRNVALPLAVLTDSFETAGSWSVVPALMSVGPVVSALGEGPPQRESACYRGDG